MCYWTSQSISLEFIFLKCEIRKGWLLGISLNIINTFDFLKLKYLKRKTTLTMIFKPFWSHRPFEKPVISPQKNENTKSFIFALYFSKFRKLWRSTMNGRFLENSTSFRNNVYVYNFYANFLPNLNLTYSKEGGKKGSLSSF